MTTSNVTLEADWVKIADETDNHFLTTSKGAVDVEYVVTVADLAPTVGFFGHILRPDDIVTRDLLGPGHLWARNRGNTQSTLVITK